MPTPDELATNPQLAIIHRAEVAGLFLLGNPQKLKHGVQTV